MPSLAIRADKQTYRHTRRVTDADDRYTLYSEKTPTYVFDYKSGISWSIFILSIPMESGMNTLQNTYLTLDDVITASHLTSQKFTP